MSSCEQGQVRSGLVSQICGGSVPCSKHPLEMAPWLVARRGGGGEGGGEEGREEGEGEAPVTCQAGSDGALGSFPAVQRADAARLQGSAAARHEHETHAE
jgi:hypothetical protein